MPKVQPKAPAETFSASELASLLKKTRKLHQCKGRKEKRRLTTEEPSYVAETGEEPRGLLSPEGVSLQAERLLEAANSSNNSSSTPAASVESSEGLAEATEQSLSSFFRGPLNNVGVDNGPVRVRPTRTVGEVSSRKTNDLALYSLLGSSRSR